MPSQSCRRTYSESIFRRVNRSEMAKLLACHIVAEGEFAGRKLVDRLKSGGPLSLKTLGGCELRLEFRGSDPSR